MNEVVNFSDFNTNTIRTMARSTLRNIAIAALSFKKNNNTKTNCIQFPYYHHVFDDEIKGFERQIKYFKNCGDFINVDDVVNIIESKSKINGKYFCISFDDGFYNCYSNMMPIALKYNAPVIIYLPTEYVGLNLTIEDDYRKIMNFHPNNPKPISFLSWENCMEMEKEKIISFGSHTCGHKNLSLLSPTEIEMELQDSKDIIRNKLSAECDHFACPWGRQGVDFDKKITTPLAQKIGYKTFTTTNRGATNTDSDLYTLKRDHLLANWSNYQLKYFFGK
jgi:peptidoglycan/xylan/chitin deacetylase (PgdA/CDA1 family)